VRPGAAKCGVTETGLAVVDVKPKDKLEDPVVADTLAWTQAAIESRGWSYEVWSKPPAVESNNLRFLSGFRRAWHFRQDLVSELRSADLDNVSIGEATMAVPEWPRSLVRSTLFHLLWLQYFHVDMSRPLSAAHVLGPGPAR
jgi:hypothetical protein